jgi:hypothetical protein
LSPPTWLCLLSTTVSSDLHYEVSLGEERTNWWRFIHLPYRSAINHPVFFKHLDMHAYVVEASRAEHLIKRGQLLFQAQGISEQHTGQSATSH